MHRQTEKFDHLVALIAQLVEHFIRNEGVAGSSPAQGSGDTVWCPLFLWFVAVIVVVVAVCLWQAVDVIDIETRAAVYTVQAQ